MLGAGAEECKLDERTCGQLCKEEVLMVYPCAGTLSFAKACMSLLKHCQFVGLIIDALCFNASLLSVVGTFARRVLNKDSDVKRSPKKLLQSRFICLEGR